MLDLIIRGARVVDGSGAPGRTADVGVTDGRIVEVGRIGSSAGEVFDADGLVLAPGFIDVHTHYDAQVFWDSALTPSPQHGVTTVISGNCGFTLAPLHAPDAAYLTQMLARVEGMPRTALESGLSWDWESVGDYLAAVEQRGVSINTGFLAGHSTLRRHVMGDRSGERSTAEDISLLERALDTALAEGALGLSTSDSATHSDESHEPVPSRRADDAELLALAAVLRSRPGTLLQCVPPSGPYSDETKDLMVALSLAADRPINWNIIVVNAESAALADNRLEASDRARRQGGCVTGLVFPTLNRLRITFDTGFFIETIPGWSEIFSLSPERRLSALADPDVRQRLRSGAEQIRRDHRFVTRWADYEVSDVDFDESQVSERVTIGAIAAERGTDPFDTLLDVVLEKGLGVGLTLPADADDDAGWALRATLAADPRTVVGGSDAGAHLDMMCGATYTTSMLSEFPKRGLMGLEKVVHQLTDVPARLYGLRGRGRIEAGYQADLVVFDASAIGPDRMGARRDLPGDTARVYAGADGVAGVWVNGVSVVRDGELSESKPGRVLRSGVDTDTIDNRAGLALTSPS